MMVDERRPLNGELASRCCLSKKQRTITFALVLPLLLASACLAGYFLNNDILNMSLACATFLSAAFYIVKAFAERGRRDMPRQGVLYTEQGLQATWSAPPRWASWMFECLGEDNRYEDGNER